MEGCPPEDRDRLLAERCGSDEELREELTSLLAASEKADEYFDDLADRSGDHIAEMIEDKDSWLHAGATLGHLTVDEEIGRGGMGRVYRARDEHLLRDVALKVLPHTLSQDPARRARLKREAQLLASLDHPSIASIHGLEQHEGHWVLVMEMVRGHTLQERLDHGAIPIDEALEIAQCMAEALEAAHQTGVVHRDLKPSNIKLPPKGGVKILDFGIAKAVFPEPRDTGDVSPSPTERIAATEGFEMMGTIAYMSPEQVRGRHVDPRTDVWAFGAILYQMLSGDRPFPGDDVASTIAMILEREPAWSALPDSVPHRIRNLLERCLTRDVSRRLQAIGEARIVIDDVRSGRGADEVSAVTSIPGRIPARWPVVGAAATIGVAVGIALGVGVIVGGDGAPDGAVHAHLDVESGYYLYGGHADDERIGSSRPSRRAFAVSGDGSLLAYAATDGATSRLFTKSLDQRLAVAMPGTEGGSAPFFSPDGGWIGFHQDGALKRIPAGGGEVSTVAASVPDLLDAHWSDTGFIVFADADEGLMRVAEAGGALERLTEIRTDQREDRHAHPHVLPGGEAVLFTIRRDPRRWDDAEIVYLSVADGARHTVIEGGTDPRFTASGHLVFARSGTLHAVEFDPGRGEVLGEPIQIVDDVMHSIGGSNDNINNAAAQFAISESGTLYYVQGGVLAEPERELLWVERTGAAESVPINTLFHLYPRVSPDGSQLAYVRVRPDADREIWVRAIDGGATRRLPLEGFNNDPVFSPDGETLAFASDEGGAVANIYTLGLDGSDAPQRITTSSRDQFPSSWSRTGVLAFVEGLDIWTIDMAEAAATARPFLETPENESWPAFSPDGQWLAYASDKSGRFEVYVRAFPEGSVEYLVSSDGGTRPAWSRDGSELFYRTGQFERSAVMAVRIQASSEFRHSPPTLLFDSDFSGASPVRDYDVTLDGRFIMTRQREFEATPQHKIELVLNWADQLERLVPTR